MRATARRTGHAPSTPPGRSRCGLQSAAGSWGHGIGQLSAHRCVARLRLVALRFVTPLPGLRGVPEHLTDALRAVESAVVLTPRRAERRRQARRGHQRPADSEVGPAPVPPRPAHHRPAADARHPPTARSPPGCPDPAAHRAPAGIASATGCARCPAASRCPSRLLAPRCPVHGGPGAMAAQATGRAVIDGRRRSHLGRRRVGCR